MSFLRRTVANPVAANMLMILILGGGVITAFWIPRELFPEFSVDMITITVPYRGATPSDIEQGICLKIEDKITGIEGVKEIASVSREGVGIVALELASDADARKVLDEVKSKVEQVDFPANAEDHEAIEVTLRQHVIMVAVAGDAPERTLKQIAEGIRDDLVDLPEISQVSLSGVRDYEITVKVAEESLRRHGLTLAQLARSIRQSAFDLPAGTVKTAVGELTIRVVGQLYDADEYEDIVVLSKADGTIVRLGDIASVEEGFEDVDIGGQFNGKRAVLVGVYKTPDEDTIEITDAVKRYVYGTVPPQGLLARLIHEIKGFLGRQDSAGGMRAQMPEGIILETWSDFSKFISDRLSMLVRNGFQGLLLVFLVLWLFLGARMSFWVALGIPVSLMGTILVLHLGGMSLNMMSMFALIMALGLIVDDAIIVGENVYARAERGEEPRLAAIEGTRGVLFPVIGAVTTTWLAFGPLIFVPGIMGRFIAILPYTVILALGFSLLECLLILPPHLGHSLLRRQRRQQRPAGRVRRRVGYVRSHIDSGIRTFIDVHFAAAYRTVTRHRYVTLTVLLGIMAVVAAAWRTGHVPFTAFPKLDSDTLRAKLLLPTGTPLARTEQVCRQMTNGALALNKQFRAKKDKPVVQRVYALLGQDTRGADSGSHVAELIVELLPAEERGVPSEDLIRRWRQNTGEIPDKLSLTFGAFHGGPGGKPLEIRLLGESTEQVEPAAERLQAELASYEGVYDIEEDALPGKLEMRIRLKGQAHSLGVNLRMLADQLRNRFHGNESIKVQRGRDEVKVRVRYPDSQRRSLGDVEQMRVRIGDREGPPFLQVADVRMQRGYTTLRRVANKSVITVSADIDEKVANAENILEDLDEKGFFAELLATYPGLKLDFRGQRQQALESLQGLKVFYPIALIGIFTILAAIFKSYFQPIIIMVTIPFGIVGAVIGHWLFGYNVTLLSLFGIVALTGIVVNDSLVLIDFVNRRVRSGEGLEAAVEAGARQRFRPIFLTTATTVAGMLPILLERSFQAQFLKPMVVSITFGLMFATLLTLLVVPSLYLVGNDLRRVLRWCRTGHWPGSDEVIRRDEALLPQTPSGPAQ